MQPYIDEINTIEDLQIRHSHLQVLYKSYNYLPIYSLRSLSSLFIQIPFFIAAYNMLKNFTGINDVSFLFFDNLGKADALLFGINVLPILMTIINIISVKLMTSFEQERKQSYIIAVFFLVLLYNSPAGIVLYWTLNNFINFIRYFIYWIRKNKFSLVFTNLKSMFKRLLSNENVTVFLLFISLYFSINLYSFGAYTRSNTGLLIILLIPFYLALLIKTGLFIKENISQIRSRNFIIKISILALLFIVSFAVYQYEKTHYLSAILVLLAVYNYKNIKIYRIKEFAKSSALSVIVILFPAILYIKSNLVYFAGNDIFTYLAVLILFSFLLPIAGYFLNKTSLNSISLFSISFVISAMFLPLIREVIGYSGETPLDFIVLFSIVLFIVSLFDKNKKIIIIFFLIAALCAATTDIKFTPMAQTDEISDETNTSIPQELLDLNMKEKDKASIYLFMHDSFPRKDLAQYLGLDYSGVEELFNEFGFTMYDVYSIGYYTRVTMTSLFDIQDHRVDEDLVNEIKGRRIMSGDNLVNFLLQAKGYTTAIAGEDNPYTYDKKLFAIGLTSGGGGIQNQVLLGIMQGHLNTMLLKHRKEGTAAMQAAEYANENAGKDKFFAWGAAGPDHSSLSLDLDMEFKKWSVKYV
ncbi:MAG: YidC/Oxa1 family membrane protein insertase, partial [Elusimicrobiota bacterium]|nr:YidC/Oxa1 family membrane protein insertase [Elusimicrobiota bacterium]